MSLVEVIPVFFFAGTKQKANGKEKSAVAFGYSYFLTFKIKKPGILALLPKLVLRRKEIKYSRLFKQSKKRQLLNTN